MAEFYHAGQKRDELEPEGAGYQIHPVRVAAWLAKLKIKNAKILIAALLHDALEDTKMPKQKINKLFGPEVLKLVLAVTRPRPANEPEAVKVQSKEKHYKNIFQQVKKVKLLKTADMLDNMRSWQYIPPGHPSQKKFPHWLYEAEKYYLPLAKKVSPIATREMRGIFKTIAKKRSRDFNNYKQNNNDNSRH